MLHNRQLPRKCRSGPILSLTGYSPFNQVIIAAVNAGAPELSPANSGDMGALPERFVTVQIAARVWRAMSSVAQQRLVI